MQRRWVARWEAFPCRDRDRDRDRDHARDRVRQMLVRQVVRVETQRQHPQPKCPCLRPTSCLLALFHEVACAASNLGPTRRLMHRPGLSIPAPTPVPTPPQANAMHPTPKCP